MKWKVLILPLLCLAAVAAGYVYAIHRIAHDPISIPSAPIRRTPRINAPDNNGGNSGNANLQIQLRSSIESVLRSHQELFKGVRLKSMDIEDGQVSLDFSQEFMQVNDLGDTGESMAQNALLRAISKYPGILKMTVLVDGQVYQGEHNGDWADIPVHIGNNASEDAQ